MGKENCVTLHTCCTVSAGWQAVCRLKESMLHSPLGYLRRLTACAFVLCAGVVPSLAGDNITESERSVQLNEVSVTAVKTGTSLDDQPLSSTVVTADEIVNDNIVNIRQVSEMAPNVYMPRYGSRMTSSIYVRGLGARIDQPVVGLIIDNVAVLNKDNYDFDIPDIERIEILRGPQSTLYGRNTMGGVINVTTLSPMRWQGVRFSAEYATYNTARVSAGVYGKLRNNLGMSLSLAYNRSDGHYVNLFNGAKTDAEQGWRASWRTVWRPLRKVTVDNSASLTVNRQSGYPYTSVPTGQINYNDTCYYRRTGILEGLTVKYVGDRCTASAVTGFQYIDDDMTLDQDFLPVDYFTLTQRRREWALTEDVVAKGYKGAYRWLGGAFAYYKRQNMHAPVTFFDYGISELIEKHVNTGDDRYPLVWDERNMVLDSRFVQPVHGLGVYHSSSYSWKGFDASVALRLEYERTSIHYRSATNTSYSVYDMTGSEPTLFAHRDINIDDTGKLHQNTLQLLPRFTLQYATRAGNLYFSAAKGYKSGGYNTQMFSDVLQQDLMAELGVARKYAVDQIITYKPEKSWNYEVGAHLNFFGGKLSANGALFYIDCVDQQITMFPDGTTTGRIMANAGKTRSMGVEFAATWRPLETLTVRGSYGYTDARFVDFNNGREDFAGKRVPYAPAHTLFAGASYSQGLSACKWLDRIVFDLSVRGVGDIMWDEANLVSQPFYALLDAQVRFEWQDISLALWGDNITSTSYDTFYFVSIGNAFLQRGRSATFGATLRVNFTTNN